MWRQLYKCRSLFLNTARHVRIHLTLTEIRYNSEQWAAIFHVLFKMSPCTIKPTHPAQSNALILPRFATLIYWKSFTRLLNIKLIAHRRSNNRLYMKGQWFLLWWCLSFPILLLWEISALPSAESVALIVQRGQSMKYFSILSGTIFNLFH